MESSALRVGMKYDAFWISLIVELLPSRQAVPPSSGRKATEALRCACRLSLPPPCSAIFFAEICFYAFYQKTSMKVMKKIRFFVVQKKICAKQKGTSCNQVPLSLLYSVAFIITLRVLLCRNVSNGCRHKHVSENRLL